MSKTQTNLKGWTKIEKPESDSSVSYWKPSSVGETLEGKILAIENGEYGKYLTIEQSSGNVMGTPSHRDLQQYIDLLKVGQSVLIEVSGTYKTKFGLAFSYTVHTK